MKAQKDRCPADGGACNNNGNCKNCPIAASHGVVQEVDKPSSGKEAAK